MRFIGLFKFLVVLPLLASQAGLASDIGIYIPKRWVPSKKIILEPSFSLGLNATQVKVSTSSDDYTSEGYMGFVVGGGVAWIPFNALAVQGDVFYSNRIFGFGDTKGFFNTWQIPLTLQLRAGNVSLGGGAYTAFWRALGRMEESGTKVLAEAGAAGQSLTEFGYLGQLALSANVRSLPLRFEFRFFKSLSDVAKSSDFKGSLTEYQFLVGFDFKKG